MATRTVNTYTATLTLISGTSVEISDSGQANAAYKAVAMHDAVKVVTDTNTCIYPYHAIASICMKVTQSEEEYVDPTCTTEE